MFFSFRFYITAFYTPPHKCGGVLWFHVGRPCVCPSVSQSVVRPSVRFSFLDDNLSYQWIFTRLGLCIDIVEILFGIANGQISSNFDGVICPRHAYIYVFRISKHQWIFTKLGMCIDILEIWFGIANGQIASNIYGVICPRHIPYFRFRMIT